MVPKILNYVETQKDTSLPVIKFRGPEELEEAFDAVGEWGLVLCQLSSARVGGMDGLFRVGRIRPPPRSETTTP